MEKIAHTLRILGDETRLRILNLLTQAPLNVSELKAILGLAQSGVSRHLGHLRKLGFLHEQKNGVWSYYHLVAPQELDGELKLFWDYLQKQLANLEDPFRDQVRLKEVLRQREDSVSGLNQHLLEPGQSWLTWSRSLGFFMPQLDVADLGCGDGTFTVEMARFSRSVVGVDHEAKVLAEAAERMKRHHFGHVKLLQEKIENLSLPTNSLDFVLFSQSLHHLEKPHLGMKEAVRVLRPGGRLVVMELAPHEEEWVREKLGHVWLGFEADFLKAMMAEAKLTHIEVETNPQRWGESFRVILASGLKKNS